MKQGHKITIVTEEENERCLKMIEFLMNKGSDNLAADENEQLIQMSQAVQAFEQVFYDIPKINGPEGI